MIASLFAWLFSHLAKRAPAYQEEEDWLAKRMPPIQQQEEGLADRHPSDGDFVFTEFEGPGLGPSFPEQIPYEEDE